MTKISVKKKNVIVTGANQGLGYAIAKKFLSEGANVAILARNEEKLESSSIELNQLKHKNSKLLSFVCDISNTEECDKVFFKIVNVFNSLDIIINNAGVFGPMGKLEDIPWSEFVENININLLGTIYMCRLAIPIMKKNKSGKIINISGGGAAKPFPALAYYAAGKAGLVRFSEELADDLKENKIDVNVVAPGPLNTRFVDLAIEAGIEKLGKSLYETILKIRENGGSLDLVAELCLYLSSDITNGLTGKFISARYDNWQNFHEIKNYIMTNEYYTMRRIDEFNVNKFSKMVRLKDL